MFFKTGSLKILQYLQENNYVGVCSTAFKKDPNTGVSSGYCEVFKISFL